MARFVLEVHYPEGTRREVYVTAATAPALNGTPLRDGTEIAFRGSRWRVRLITDGDDVYVLTPAGAP